MERALLEVLRRTCLHPAVAIGLRVIIVERPYDASIASVTGMSGLSAKRFIERFKSEVGMTPKCYSQLLRFQQTVALADRARRMDWTRIAMDSGYFDQAHFIRDFRSFSGMTPTAYQAARTEFRNHVKFVQASAAPT